MSGAFVAIVGPSGSGKDAIIRTARQSLAGARDVVFPRRCITRPDGPGEVHIPYTEAEFAEAEATGRFALSWRAHGLSYGIPTGVRDVVLAGAVAVQNVSRETLPRLADVFGRAYSVRVSVPEAVRLERILARGREDSDAAASRLRRQDPTPDYPVDLDILNDGSLDDAAAELVALIEGIRASAS